MKVLIKDATATLNEKLACQKITDSIDISNYTMDLKVAMATILRLGLFEKDSCNLLFPNIDQCIRGYTDTYSSMISGEKLYITTLENGRVLHDVNASISIIY